MIRSFRSIIDQIAEGYGRFHYQENIQYCRQARGSAYELKNQFITALDCKYISDDEFQVYEQKIVRCVKMINGYINYLKKAKKDEPIPSKMMGSNIMRIYLAQMTINE